MIVVQSGQIYEVDVRVLVKVFVESAWAKTPANKNQANVTGNSILI